MSTGFEFETVTPENQEQVLEVLLPLPPEVRTDLAARAGPGWLWWWGVGRTREELQQAGGSENRWRFSGLHSSARWAGPLTPHPDAPLAISGGASLSIWLPSSPTAVTSVAMRAAADQRLWRMTMNRALDLRLEHTRYLMTLGLGEAVRLLLACLDLRPEREIGTGADAPRFGLRAVGPR